MRRMAVIALFLPVLLLACAGNGRWVKPGVASDRIAYDTAQCESEARAAVRRDENIDADILASRGTDWSRNDTLAAQRMTMAMHNEPQREQVVARCMASKGYSPAGGK